MIADDKKISKILLEMNIYSTNDFFPSDLTKSINLNPTDSWQKGEKRPSGKIKEENCWLLSTSFMKTFYFEDVYKAFYKMIEGKEREFQNYIIENKLNTAFEIAVYIYYPETPALTLPINFIKLACLLNATIDIDTYIFVDE